MSDAKEQIKGFWDRTGNYDHIAAHGIHSVEEKAIWKSLFQDTFKSGDKIKILDMGTGSGFLALLLAEMEFEVTGADWSETMLEKAKSKVNSTSLQVEFVIEDTENLSFNNERFDALVSRHMLWTLTNPQKAISEWGRVIKPGGMVLVDIPLEAVGKHHFNEEIGKELPFYNGAKPDDIATMFFNAGFVNEQRSEFNTKDDKKIIIMKWEKPLN